MPKAQRNWQRGTGSEKPNKFIIVFAEGRKTETIYLNAFKPPREGAVQLKVLPNSKDKSSPTEVLQRLKNYEATHQIEEDDELWLVLDRDSWREEELNEVAAEAARCGFHLALSNPCIEYWFYLHLKDNKLFNHRRQLLPEMEKLLDGYGKGSFDAELLAAKVDDAISRAKALDTNPTEAWPRNQGSRMYRLMEKILG